MAARATIPEDAERRAPRTVLEYLKRAVEYLARRDTATARLDAEVLLASVLSTDRVGVYLRFDHALTVADADAFRALLQRRAAGEPVAHLTGRREFWSLDLAVTPDVLTPRPETELLVERALEAMPERAGRYRVLDLGTGSGAIAVAIASERVESHVVAIDRSPAAARIALDNARARGVAERVDVAIGDWTTALRCASRFDVVVSNPPYVVTSMIEDLPAEVRREPRLALDGGADGLDAYRALLPGAASLLTTGGTLAVEVGLGQAEAVSALLAQAGLVGVGTHRDLSGVARVVTGCAAEEGCDAEDRHSRG